MTVEEHCKQQGISVGEYAEQIIAKWPEWRQELARQLMQPYPPYDYHTNLYSSWGD